MNSFSPGLISPSSRRASSSIAAGSFLQAVGFLAQPGVLGRAPSASDCSSAAVLLPLLQHRSTPLSPTSASMTSTQPTKTSRYCTVRRRGAAESARSVLCQRPFSRPDRGRITRFDRGTATHAGNRSQVDRKSQSPVGSRPRSFRTDGKQKRELIRIRSVVLVLTTLGADADAPRSPARSSRSGWPPASTSCRR